MKIVNVHTAKTTLSQLLAEVESGEEIVIARNGKPIARMVPYAKSELRLPPGFGAHTGRIIGELDPGPVFEPSDYTDPELYADD